MSPVADPAEAFTPVPKPPRALTTGEIAVALHDLVSPWLGPAEWPLWEDRLREIPLANRVFLEMHLDSPEPRCDVVTSITSGDGSLAAWLAQRQVRTGPAWEKALVLLDAWQNELVAGYGPLRDLCLMMWFEFDMMPGEHALGAPSLFIALAPRANLDALASRLGAYPELRGAVMRLATTLAQGKLGRTLSSNPLLLGHIGYMAARQLGAIALPLRSCWRCDDVAHMLLLLEEAGVRLDKLRFVAELERIGPLLKLGNSLMLDLDSQDQFLDTFAVEINLFQRDIDKAMTQVTAVLGLLERLGFVTAAAVARLGPLSGSAATPAGRNLYCLLHHVKFRIENDRIVEVKLYWLVRVIDHVELTAARDVRAPLIFTAAETRMSDKRENVVVDAQCNK